MELGTVYGMSGLFILSALKALGDDRHLATLEGMEPQFSLASTTLRGRDGDMVLCHFGMTQDALPGLASSPGTRRSPLSRHRTFARRIH